MPAFLTKAFSLSTLLQILDSVFDVCHGYNCRCKGETLVFNVLHGMVVNAKYWPNVHGTFALLKQYAQGKISEMLTLTKIDVELAVVGIPFDQEEWLDLMGMKTNPLLEDPVAWQLVLQWAADDNVSFANFLTEMEAKFKDRYKFDEWKIVFSQVFKASHEGNAVEVVRAAMAKRGVLEHPTNVSCSLPSPQASSSQPRGVGSNGPLPPAKCLRPNNLVRRFLDTSTQDNDDDKSIDENN
ncbi:hypothetical protein EDD16DRAFT_1523965 [Pisolithus croceorrhizus]|nr:hypothetical protein EV401DRAFT_1895333 [Pisolithus croceorrhizus]KAI6106406.1 hypothetical protein EDD16DRAFT_1523965 [Pisolithus croceorrhizus]